MWTTIYQGIRKNRVCGIYRLPNGAELLNALDSLMTNYQEHLYCRNLLPGYFSSPHQLLTFLRNYREDCKKQLKWMLALPMSELQDSEVGDIIEMHEDVIEMTTYCLESYEVNIIDNTYLKPYLDMKACLDSEDIDEFVTILDSIFNKIPYLIHKGRVNEALFHCVIHAVMNQLGFECDSEKPTTKGRMDMWLKMKNRVYIFEFKYSKEDKDMSKEAIQQIKDRKYADQYLIKKTRVIAVGVTFGKEKRNVIGSYKEVLTAKLDGRRIYNI